VEELGHDIIHKIPYTPEQIATDNFWRGKISAYEDLIGLAEESKEWREKK
jgi:hypothetical protein